MLLYENVFKIPNSEIEWERIYDTETNKSHFNKIQLNPKLYISHPYGKYRYFLDKSVKLEEKTFSSTKDMSIWMKSMDDINSPYYGKTTPKYQYIRDTYYFRDGEYVNNDHTMRIWYLDIEVSQEFGFPFPSEAKAPITLIQIYDNIDDKYYIFGYKDIEGFEDPRNLDRCKEACIKHGYPTNTTYVKVQDEMQLFEYFSRMIKSKLPNIITAWNGELFDFPYIVNRADKIGYNKNNLSPVGSCTCTYKKQGNSDFYSTDIAGVYLLDLMILYKKFIFTPQTSYSLNNISKVELGAEKVQYDEYVNLDDLMEDDYPRFVLYGIIDSQLIRDIDTKLNLINLVKSIAYKMGINLDDALGTVRPWGTYITNIAFKDGFILPNDGIKNEYNGMIKGAWVADPVVGKHEWIVSFDWASLYPSIIRWCNLSPETWIPTNELNDDLKYLKDKYFIDDEDHLIENYEELKTISPDILKKHNVSAGINGSFYRRDEVGLVPILIKNLYAERKASKKTMFDYTKIKERIKGVIKERQS